MMLRQSELSLEILRDCRIFHFGSLSLTHAGVREATMQAVKTAKHVGALISFDPNLRPPLWNSLDDAKRQMEYGLSVCDILKIADNEIEFLTGESDFDKGAAVLKTHFPNIRMLNVTAGADGSYSYYGSEQRMYVPSFCLGGTIETTGAGDTFCACVLNFVLEHGIMGLSDDDRKQMLRFANAAAYLVTTKKGAIRSMPEKKAVDEICR